MPLPAKKRVPINITLKEWEQVESRLKQMRKKDWGRYIATELVKIERLLKKYPDLAPEKNTKVRKLVYVAPETLKKIKSLAQKYDMSEAALVHEFIIKPLLQETLVD